MTTFDFVEIGTSNFRTEIEKASHKTIGLSVEPLNHYLKQLPNKKKCKKENCAISNYEGSIRIFYVTVANIKKYKLPKWVRGCNSVNRYHPTVKKLLLKKKLDPKRVITEKKVQVKPFQYLIDKYNIKRIKFLKVDTEGHDSVIMNNYIDMCLESPSLWADKIQFEANILTALPEVKAVIKRLEQNKYLLVKFNRKTDALLIRNNHTYLSTFRMKTKYPHHYLPGYPANFDPKNMPYANNIQAAMAWAITQPDCGGITLHNGRYEARKGWELLKTKKSDTSWIRHRELKNATHA